MLARLNFSVETTGIVHEIWRDATLNDTQHEAVDHDSRI